jgi:acyl-coenzyme A thioesterase PaaI-like protein
MQTQFQRPAFPGRLTCDAVVTQAGKTTAFAESRLFDGDGKLLATATGVAALQPR